MKEKAKDKGIEKIKDAIEEYIAMHDNQVIFYGDFMALDVEPDDCSGDVTFCYGMKKDIFKLLKDFKKMVKEEKDVFVNW